MKTGWRKDAQGGPSPSIPSPEAPAPQVQSMPGLAPWDSIAPWCRGDWGGHTNDGPGDTALTLLECRVLGETSFSYGYPQRDEIPQHSC